MNSPTPNRREDAVLGCRQAQEVAYRTTFALSNVTMEELCIHVYVLGSLTLVLYNSMYPIPGGYACYTGGIYRTHTKRTHIAMDITLQVPLVLQLHFLCTCDHFVVTVTVYYVSVCGAQHCLQVVASAQTIHDVYTLLVVLPTVHVATSPCM